MMVKYELLKKAKSNLIRHSHIYETNTKAIENVKKKKYTFHQRDNLANYAYLTSMFDFRNILVLYINYCEKLVSNFHFNHLRQC